MESYPGVTPLWDISSVDASQFSQLPDDDFLALLQKQFPNSNDGFNPASFDAGIDPQSIQPFALPGLSPPSDDSPSPPSNDGSDSRSQSISGRPRADTDGDDPLLKRKASDDSMDEEPSSKNPHTEKRTSTSRRKSNGNPDESRLMKRKEQNRAAQRAFRERKEKHVKDLEDQVAALEAKNEQATSENTNLRDLLARLQDENVTLKQAAFTFSVPKPTANSAPVASGSNQPAMNLFNSPQSSMSSPVSAFSPPPPRQALPQIGDGMDWTSLTTFDPAVLSLLDESPPQATATSSAMNMDFGFGSSDDANKSPFTTIAANPMFMSFADFDADSTFTPASTTSDSNNLNFDFNSWSNSSQASSSTNGLDDLFGGSFAGKQGNVDFNALMMSSQSSIGSPVIHHRQSPETSGSSSSSASTSNTSHQSPASSAGTSPDHELYDEHGEPKRCPKTKEEAASMMKLGEQSAFVKEPTLHKEEGALLGKIVACKGSSLPSTMPRSDDVEVLTAWRSVTKNPNFKDADINELCSEFSSKARCDGSRVVVEGSSYQQLLAKLASQRSSSQ